MQKRKKEGEILKIFTFKETSYKSSLTLQSLLYVYFVFNAVGIQSSVSGCMERKGHFITFRELLS
jgi:hypothetical protein